MDDRRENRIEARHIAAFSLGVLLQRDSSTEAGVRAVLRVAAPRDSAFWKVWAFMQLTDFFEAEPGSNPLFAADREIEHIITDSEQRGRVLERVYADYLGTRRTQTGSPEHYLADIGDLERDVPIFETWLVNAQSHAERLQYFEQRDMRRTILNRVKNAVQRYLMHAERADHQGSADENDAH